MPRNNRQNRLAQPRLPLRMLVLGLFACAPLLALETDRQQPLLINADSSDGTLGDGRATLRGHVEIRQGTLLVKADQADVEKAEGKVREVLLTGSPVLLQQEIENEGLVTATANRITYQVATGIVTLTGNADVNHPQYQISGELLVYDMNLQHFQGSGGDNNGRIRIQLEPEVIAPLESPTREGESASGTAEDSDDSNDPGAAPDQSPGQSADQDADQDNDASN